MNACAFLQRKSPLKLKSATSVVKTTAPNTAHLPKTGVAMENRLMQETLIKGSKVAFSATKIPLTRALTPLKKRRLPKTVCFGPSSSDLA